MMVMAASAASMAAFALMRGRELKSMGSVQRRRRDGFALMRGRELKFQRLRLPSTLEQVRPHARAGVEITETATRIK